MKDARAALRYAKAILNLAKDAKKDSAVNKDMQLIASTISENPELAVVLQSPVIKSADKINVLKATFSKQVNNITLGLFNLLQEKKNLNVKCYCKAIHYNF
jgi:F-type H+-transporting ATPase subunit delta